MNTDQRVVVIGASSGLGRAIAVGLGRRGASVALLARRKDRLDIAAAKIGEQAAAIACDVTNPRSCTEAIEAAAGALGGIEALVCSTGTMAIGPVEALDAEKWAHLFATNVTGAALCTAAALPHLDASGGAAVYLSSVSASLTPPWPGLGGYVTSKAALDKLVEVWRTEWLRLGYMTGNLIDVGEVIDAVGSVLGCRSAIPSLTITPVALAGRER
jgi:NAD(P)-dependent dehydrogenase (short-subunit alcohol dehydrogenase family)